LILTGQKFNRLNVLNRGEDYISPKGVRTIRWRCKCDCGSKKDVLVTTSQLKLGIVKSCGCLSIEQTIKFNKETKKKYNTYDLTGEYGIGYTFKGEEFYFDLEDYDKIKDYCWCIDSRDYVVANNKYNNICKLHRIILKDVNWRICDHINRNPKDNRKSNLREANYNENAFNRSKNKRNTSGVTGVYFDKDKGKWRAVINKNGITYRLGRFKDKEKAIIARLEAEKEYFGEFAPQKHLYEKYNIS